MKRFTPILSVAAAFIATVAVARAQDKVTTLAGQAQQAGFSNGPAALALFSDPAGIAADASGNFFIADSANHVIRKFATNGLVSTIAGTPEVAGSADSPAAFDSPSGVCVDAAGNLFVADTGNHTIRKIAANGTVTTLAGLAGEAGATNGPGATARFNSPLGIVVATNGILFIADSGNHLLRKISPDGTVTTLAGEEGVWGTNDGPGLTAHFNNPVGLALDAAGNLFVADANNHTIRKVAPDGTVSTVAGVPGADGCVNGPAADARFCKPASLAFDAHGNLFIADSFNHVLRRLSPRGFVTTVSGLGGADGVADGANGTARFFNPYGLATDARGRVLIADTYNQTLRVLLPPFTVEVQASVIGGVVTLTWPTILGAQYQLQWRDASSTNWQNLGGAIAATGTQTTASDTAASAAKLYRVLRLD
ncbi:MAG: hypothetical protein HY301_13590 [Verrucomicrobia bacterium]|nr:hypothetical protein [Verrucomicrobiota bacterium]